MARRRAVAYLRVSTAEQTNGFGLELQDKAVRAYCKTHGFRLVQVEQDGGQSGGNGLDTRLGLARALVAVENGEAEALVVYRLDRLARDLVLGEVLIQRVRAAGAEVLSVTEDDIDSDDPTRVLTRQVLGAISQYERAVIRARMMAGKAAKAATGGYVGGRPPYGWQSANGALVPVEREQEAIATARQLHRQGLSTRQIASELTEAGYQPKSGGTWHPPQVARLLADR